MDIERGRLVKLLRARNSDRTAHRAEQSLPQHIDLERDRGLLRQCGIDPNVLSVILSVEDGVTEAAEPLPQRSEVDDHLDRDRAHADGALRLDRAERWPSDRATRMTAATAAAKTKWFRRRSPETTYSRGPG